MLNKIIQYSLHNRLLVMIAAVALLIWGSITAHNMEVDVFPDLNAPTVVVMTEAQGMAPEEVERLVTFPVETAVNGATDVRRVRSSSTTGFSVVWVEFEWGTNIYTARQIVSEKLATLGEALPDNVGTPTLGPQSSILGEMMIIGLTADSTSLQDLRTIADWTIRPRLLSTGGVAQVAVIGGDIKEYQILLDPARMKYYNIGLDEVLPVVENMNQNATGGILYEYGNEYIIQGVMATTRVEEIGKAVIKTVDDFPITLADIANVQIGAKTPKLGVASEKGKPAVLVTVTKQPGTNTLELTDKLDASIQELRKTLPEDVEVSTDIFRQSRFINSSIHNIQEALLEGAVFVIVVLFFFLMNFRTTIISLVALPLSMLMAILVMHALGLTINTMSLGGLAIAIGSLVDDAIVVVEGVHAKLDQGYTSARLASIDAMNELGGAIVSITLVMMAVFVPVSFMGGTAGTFYRQFGMTMAIAIGLSALNALTLSPALCAILLKPHKKEDGTEDSTLKERMKVAYTAAHTTMINRYTEAIGKMLHPGITLTFTIIAILGMIFGFFSLNPVVTAIFVLLSILALIGMSTKKFKNRFNDTYESILKRYKKRVLFFIQKKWLSMGLVTASIVLLIFFMNTTPTGMVPNEDTGTLMGAVTLPPGTSQDRSEKILARVDSLIASDPAVLSRTMISGFSFIGGQGPSYGSFIIKLKDWDERSMIQNSDVVVGSLYMRAQKIIKEAQVLFFAPPMIPGYSASTDIEVNMQDKTGGDLNKFFDVVNDYTAALEARPEINSAKTSFNPNFPQYMIDIDAAACKKAGISPSDILTTMQGYYGGLYASNFNRFGKMYRVMIQSDPLSRKNLESLKNIKVRNSAGEMAPIAQFISVEKVYGPDIISRFNLYTSMKVMVAPASGYTSGQALAALAEVAQENLPTGYTYELGGMAREEAQSSGSATGLIFVLCFVFVYLLLSAQYESYILPLAVLLSVPFGLLGSFLFVNGVSALGNISALKMILGTMSNNIYMQIALIMLMGLLAKNAILIVEFALDRRKMGMSITWAAVLGAGARLRPILMTSLAMVVGLLPLMFAFGVGAHGNRTLGTASIGGMLIGMICQIFIVPVLFVIFQYLQEKVKPMEWEDIDNTDAVTEIEQYAK